MKKLRLLLISFIALLGLFFNIERLDVSNEAVVNIESFVYGLGLLAAIVIIGFPSLGRKSILNLLGLGLIAYLVSKMIVFNGRPLFGGVYIFLTVTEVCLLSLIIWLSYQLGQTIHQVEENVLAFTNQLLTKKLPDAKKSQKIVSTEITRSRHYERPMSILTIHLGQDSWQTLNQATIQEIQEKSIKQYAKAEMANAIRQTLRRMDTVLDMKQENGLMILCPEADEVGATTLMDHVQTEIERSLDIKVTTNSATFPADGLTFSALIEKLDQKSQKKKASNQKNRSVNRHLKLQE